jgi:hypothetical protein
MRRATSALVARKAASNNVALPAVQHRNIEVLSVYWLASWAMMWQWNFYTFFPLLMMDTIKPSTTVSKTPLLHGFEDKRVEMKLQRALDETVTSWSNDIDNSAIDEAIARTF